jgi:hypothetical protein
MQWSCFPREKWLRLSKAIDDLPLAQNDPLSRESILRELDRKLGTQYAATLCCQANQTLAATRNTEKKIIMDPDSFKDQRLQSFVKFCSECHLYQDLPPPFLAGKNEEQVLNNIKNRADLIQFRLENKQMPPHFARHQLSVKERQDLLQDLRRISE